MKPIYKPKGKAREYGDYAINIYTGCPHRCYYCFAPPVLRKDKETFHSHVEPRKGIVEAVKKQIDKEQNGQHHQQTMGNRHRKSDQEEQFSTNI